MTRKIKLLFALVPALALSQSIPNGGTISNGQVWSVAQWDAAWQSKADTNSPALTGTPTVNGNSLLASAGCTSVQLLSGTGGCINTTNLLAPTYGGSGAAGTLTGVLYGNGTSPFTAATATQIGNVWGCTGNEALGPNGTCITSATTSFNVQNYGADPTGVNDSTTDFQTAITAACSVGGTLKIPYGTYKISSTLNGCNTAPFWMSIEGDAEYKTYINWAGSTPTFSGVTITGTAGQFGCTCTNLAVGQTVTLSGTYGGTGSISGYVNPSTYRIVATNGTSTFTLQSLLNQAALVTTAGTPTGITYTPGVSVFYMVGWGSSTIRNLTLNLGSNTGVTGWNLDLNSTVQSSENLTFTNVLVQGTGTNMIGWRLGETSAGGNDFSFINWENCSVHGNLPGGTVEAGSYGWLITSANALNLQWFGGNAYYVSSGFSNVRPTNGGYAGNGSDYFYGFGTSHNTTDFTFASGTQYGIYGGRYELGTTFLDVVGYLAYTQATVSGVEITGYPYNGVLFNLVGSIDLDLEGSHVEAPVGGTLYTNSLITAYNDGGPVFQTINLRNNLIQGPEPYWSTSGTNTGGATRFHLEGGLAQATSGSGATNLMQDTLSTFVAGNTSTAPAPNTQNGAIQQWTQNGNVTWGVPTGPYAPGQLLTLIVNHDGTTNSYTTAFNTTYRNAPTIAASATANARASWIFMYDGTDWQYIGGSSAFATP